LVSVTYRGRLGNNLSEYCVGRIIAEHLGFNLRAAPIPGFPNVKSLGVPVGEPIDPCQRLDGHRIDLARILSDRSPRHIVLSGFFQRYEYFRPYKTVIRDGWLAGDAAEAAGLDELTIHVRAGDTWRIGTQRAVHTEYHALPFSFYRSIVRSRRWSRVTVVTDDPSDPMVRKLADDTSGEVQSGSVLDDFNVMRASANLVLSVSTYAWWAGWLSNARQIFFPVAGIFDEERVRLKNAAWQQNLWVDDEPRYQAIRPKGVEGPWTGSEDDRQRLLNS
jgi:hypothetical protein